MHKEEEESAAHARRIRTMSRTVYERVHQFCGEGMWRYYHYWRIITHDTVAIRQLWRDA